MSIARKIRMSIALLMAIAFALNIANVPVARADSVDVKPYISLGADLNKSEKKTVLGLLGVAEADLSKYEVVQITNQQEHEHLDNYLSKSVIGTRALSSVKIEKVEEGKGIAVRTNNITYCTSGMYTNALTTAGITDADVTVAGPFNISGTAALVGAMTAYSNMTGEDLDDASEDAATNELVVTSDLGSSIGGEKAEEFVAYVKQKVVDGGVSSAEDIGKIIDEGVEEFNINLTEEQRQKLIDLMGKISSLDLDVDNLKAQAESVYNKLKDLDINVDEAKGLLDKIVDFFKSIADKISSWF